MSRYVRQRDTGPDGYGACCTCGRLVHWKKADAGHFISRGIGGRSGVYFDERNVHLQCKPCNAWRQGAADDYHDFMVARYGQKVVDELKVKDKTNRYSRMDLEGLLVYYQSEIGSE